MPSLTDLVLHRLQLFSNPRPLNHPKDPRRTQDALWMNAKLSTSARDYDSIRMIHLPLNP